MFKNRIKKFLFSFLILITHSFTHSTHSSAMIDITLKEELHAAVRSKTGGVELSALYQRKILEKFSNLPMTAAALRGNPCILFAVGSVGRMEGVYGSDLEAGLFCKDPVDPATQRSIYKTIESEAPGMIWDAEFTIYDNIFSADSFATALSKTFSSKLLKFLDATPIAYINCTEETFSFLNYREVLLKYIFDPHHLEGLLKSAEKFLFADLISIKSTIEDHFTDQTTDEELSIDQFLELTPPHQREALFRNPTADPQQRDPLLYKFDLKDSFYRPLSTSIMVLYLKFCALNPDQCTPASWRTSSHDRLKLILESYDQPIFSQDSRNIMDTFLALRMGAKTHSESNHLASADFSNSLFFGSIPEDEVFHMFSTVLKIQAQQRELFKPAAPAAL
jgi:hypothetical protein